LNVTGSTPGVSKVVGPLSHVPAYKFRPGYNNVLVPDPGAIAAALTSPAGFTLFFVYRQQRKSLGENSAKQVNAVCVLEFNLYSLSRVEVSVLQDYIGDLPPDKLSTHEGRVIAGGTKPKYKSKRSNLE
jgi:hypothetical protein